MSQTIQLNAQLQSRLGITPEQIEEFCQRWQIAELALFGSVLRDDFRADSDADSDIDVLVVFDSYPQFSLSLMDLVKMEQALESMCKREFDLIEKFSIENSHNWIRRKNILDKIQIRGCLKSRHLGRLATKVAATGAKPGWCAGCRKSQIFLSPRRRTLFL